MRRPRIVAPKLAFASNRETAMNKSMLAAALLFASTGITCPSIALAQVGGLFPSAQLPADRSPTASLQDYLTSNLRATLPEQQQFVAAVVQQVNLKRLDTGLAIALARYAQRRNASFPFPFFERSIRYEAAKRGVTLPAIDVIRFSGVRHPASAL